MNTTLIHRHKQQESLSFSSIIDTAARVISRKSFVLLNFREKTISANPMAPKINNTQKHMY